MNRRQFLRGAGLATSAALVAASPLAAAAKAARGKKVRWRMVLAWSVHMDLFKRGAIRFARQVSLLSESRLAIDVTVAPQDASPADVLAMVRSGEADCAHAFAHHLADKEPAMHWFSSIPFGMTPAEHDAWLYYCGGNELWKEACLPFDFYPRPMGDTGPGLFGWSRRPLHGLVDFNGLRIPAHGPAARALEGIGAVPVTEADGPETVAALGRNDVDCAAWHGPHHEYLMGFHKTGAQCYAPGWWAPASRMMLCLNRKAFESVPAILRIIINAAAAEEDHRLTAEFAARNAQALNRLNRDHGIAPDLMPHQVLRQLQIMSRDALADLANTSPMARMIANSYAKARKG